MNDIRTSSSLTRRSFIKRSVVTAVAVSSMTIFSGLVRANLPGYNGNGLPCVINKNDGWFGDGVVFPENQEVAIKFCRVASPSCARLVECGRFFILDANGAVQLGANGQPLTKKVVWNCDEMEDNPFSGPEFPGEPLRVPVLMKCLP